MSQQWSLVFSSSTHGIMAQLCTDVLTQKSTRFDYYTEALGKRPKDVLSHHCTLVAGSTLYMHLSLTCYTMAPLQIPVYYCCSVTSCIYNKADMHSSAHVWTRAAVHPDGQVHNASGNKGAAARAVVLPNTTHRCAEPQVTTDSQASSTYGILSQQCNWTPKF